MPTMIRPWQGAPHQQARPRGRHSLRSRAFADELVRDAGVAPGMLVLDLGAGGGVLTRALADAGARVRAVELDPAALRQLRTRFGGDPRVEVVEGDATSLPLPDEPFAVVANLPFAAGTAILRRLLGDPRVPSDAARRDRGVGARREADGRLAVDGARLHVGSVVRAEPRPARAARVLRAAAERRRRGPARDAARRAARPAGAGGRVCGAPAPRVRGAGAARPDPPAPPRPSGGARARLRSARRRPRPRRAPVGEALRGRSDLPRPAHEQRQLVAGAGHAADRDVVRADHEVDVDLALVDSRQVGGIRDRASHTRRRARRGAARSRRAAC